MFASAPRTSSLGLTRALCALALSVGLSGCAAIYKTYAVYQPLSGLHEPAVVDPAALNFEDVSLTVRCFRGELSRSQSDSLCEKVSALFENQGAKVYTVDGDGPADDSVGDMDEDEVVEGADGGPPRTDLVLELRSRQVSQSVDRVSWMAFSSTFSIYPGEKEFVFAQDVVVRGGDGVLLSTESLQGRVVERIGLAMSLFAEVKDGLSKDPAYVPMEKVAAAELSADLYQQLSQIVYNAKLQWRVQQEARAARGVSR